MLMDEEGEELLGLDGYLPDLEGFTSMEHKLRSEGIRNSFAIDKFRCSKMSQS